MVDDLLFRFRYITEEPIDVVVLLFVLASMSQTLLDSFTLMVLDGLFSTFDSVCKDNTSIDDFGSHVVEISLTEGEIFSVLLTVVSDFLIAVSS